MQSKITDIPKCLEVRVRHNEVDNSNPLAFPLHELEYIVAQNRLSKTGADIGEVPYLCPQNIAYVPQPHTVLIGSLLLLDSLHI